MDKKYKELFKITCQSCLDVYEQNIDLGTTEYTFETITFEGAKFHLLAFTGTNEFKDWFANLNPLSWCGIKRSAAKAATEVYKQIHNKIKYPIIVTGHSKAGAEAIAYKRLYGARYCVAYSPARSLKSSAKQEMHATWCFIDPDDPVSKFFRFFRHPVCYKLYGEDDPEWLDISDHAMRNWKSFIKKL